MAKNHIKPMDFLDGSGEAAAFDGKEYVKLHQSTLRKVDVLSNIAERTYNRTLRTNATLWDIHGGSLRAAAEHLKDHWMFALIGFVAAMITIGAAFATL
jgi:hypothetical protein